jgi:DNA polymerase-3 subunit delta
MVAIKSHEAGRILARLAPHIFLYLVFGPDAGLVSERVRGILRQTVADPKDPFQLLRISGDELAADPLRLADEANTIPLFGGRRAIHVDAGGKSFVAALEPLLAAPPKDCAIVIEAGALKKDAPLRKFCEREKCVAAIECYPDSARDLADLITETAASCGLSITVEAKELLASLLGEDRLVTRLELEKLMSYAHGQGEIRVDHVEAIVSDAAKVLVDEPVKAAFSGDFAALEESMRRIIGESGDVNFLLGSALRHAMALHRARLSAEVRGSGAGDGPRSGFFVGQAQGGMRRSADFDAHLRIWTVANLLRVALLLGDAIRDARLEPKLSRAIAMRAFWKIASAARKTQAAKRDSGKRPPA